ncbi:hypothetical protein ACI65C_000104 [Semiaphis heraclei]
MMWIVHLSILVSFISRQPKVLHSERHWECGPKYGLLNPRFGSALLPNIIHATQHCIEIGLQSDVYSLSCQKSTVQLRKNENSMKSALSVFFVKLNFHLLKLIVKLCLKNKKNENKYLRSFFLELHQNKEIAKSENPMLKCQFNNPVKISCYYGKSKLKKCLSKLCGNGPKGKDSDTVPLSPEPYNYQPWNPDALIQQKR